MNLLSDRYGIECLQHVYIDIHNTLIIVITIINADHHSNVLLRSWLRNYQDSSHLVIKPLFY